VNLVRLILIGVVVWVVLQALRRILGFLNPPKSPPPPGSTQNMVRCARCGLHLPEAEAIKERGEYYCCEEHRRQQADSA